MKVIVFGFGELGKKLIDECLSYESNIEIIAIADNKCNGVKYKGISIIMADEIVKYEYDKVWVCTVYFKEIITQLISLGISDRCISYTEPVVPILEYRIRQSLDFDSKEYAKEIDYIKENQLRMYCYDFYDEYLFKDTEIYFDKDKGLFYGFYCGHKMYLSRKFNTQEKARAYFNSVTMEQDERSPHCYWNDSSIIEQSGISVDVGAAEGIYGLRIIEQIEHLYMFEVDEDWIEALNYTFEPYKDKVTIISKYISNVDEESCAQLDTLLKNQKINTIKMDIEGAEIEALEGAKHLINEYHPNLAVCVYHRKNDNDIITDFCMKNGYKTANSDGYVVCQGEWELEKNEVGFRKAILWAKQSL